MRKNYITFSGFVFLIFLFSCKKEQEIPAYLFIPDVKANGIYSISGSDSSKIYGAKVFLNGTLIGVYQTPVEVPIFAEGDQDIQFVALIEKDGFSDALVDYPFFEFAQNSVFLTRDSTISTTPVVNYLPATNLDYWFEDFDGQGMKFVNSENSTSELDITHESDKIYEGAGSGLFKLGNDSAYIRFFRKAGFWSL